MSSDKVRIQREFIMKIHELAEKDKKWYDEFLVTVISKVFRYPEYEAIEGFEDSELQKMYERTLIVPVREDKQGLIGFKRGRTLK